MSPATGTAYWLTSFRQGLFVVIRNNRREYEEGRFRIREAGVKFRLTSPDFALFCAAGGLTRYYLSGWIYNILGRAFPYGTLAVNIIGAYFIGLIMELGLRGTAIPDTMRIGLTVGFMGGLTTFSTFSYETFRLLEDGQFITAFANVLVSVAVCLICTWLGILTIRSIS